MRGQRFEEGIGRKRETVDLTEGPVSKKLILFAFPMMIGNLLRQFYNIIDTPVVGRFLADAAGILCGTGDRQSESIKRNGDGCKEKGFMVIFP